MIDLHDPLLQVGPDVGEEGVSHHTAQDRDKDRKKYVKDAEKVQSVVADLKYEAFPLPVQGSSEENIAEHFACGQR